MRSELHRSTGAAGGFGDGRYLPGIKLGDNLVAEPDLVTTAAGLPPIPAIPTGTPTSCHRRSDDTRPCCCFGSGLSIFFLVVVVVVRRGLGPWVAGADVLILNIPHQFVKGVCEQASLFHSKK